METASPQRRPEGEGLEMQGAPTGSSQSSGGRCSTRSLQPKGRTRGRPHHRPREQPANRRDWHPANLPHLRHPGRCSFPSRCRPYVCAPARHYAGITRARDCLQGPIRRESPRSHGVRMAVTRFFPPNFPGSPTTSRIAHEFVTRLAGPAVPREQRPRPSRAFPPDRECRCPSVGQAKPS